MNPEPPKLPENGCRIGNDCGLGKCQYEPPNSRPICVCDYDAENEGGDRYGVSISWFIYAYISLNIQKCIEISTTTESAISTTPTVSWEPVTEPDHIVLPPQLGGCLYLGDRNVTKNGKTCSRWDDDTFHYTEKPIKQLFEAYKIPMDHNYCRYMK